MGAPTIPSRLGSRRTWGIVAAALVPLALLLLVQYRWLQRLERVSAVAHRATLDNYLEAVVSAVELRYRTLAERALNLPPGLFENGRLGKAAYHFAKKGDDGARALFVVPLTGESAGMPQFFDPATETLGARPWTEEVRAVYVAVAPWKVIAAKGGHVERAALQVEVRDPEHRMILNPVSDEAGRLVGLSGLIVDFERFESTVLREAIDAALPKFFGDDRARRPVVSLARAGGAAVDLTGGGAAARRPPEATRPVGFLFPDLELGIRSGHETAAAWARRNFLLNLALSALLASAVAGGVLFALRAAAREMKLSQMKSDFVSNVSHELRTPLASIRVFGELLRLGRVDSAEKVREYGEYIETESRRLTQLVNNILDLARIESGRKSYRFAIADLEAVVGETLRTFRVSLAQSGFRISYLPPLEPLPPLPIDEAAVAQSIGNLLDNAIKYSGEARDVEIGMRREGAHAVVWVRDRGIGIAPDDQERIFERFHRVSTGLVHDVKGSGLGLAIVRHVAEAHGGRVEVASRPGAGSTFSLFLPLAPAAAALASAELGTTDPRTSEA